MRYKKLVLISTVLISALMILSSLAALFPAYGQNNQTSAAAGNSQTVNVAKQLGNSPTLSAKAQNILNTLQSKGIPSQYVYLPSFKRPDMSGQNVTGPNYTSAPAPMGIGTYGFSNNSGTINRYTLNTSSFAASVSFNNFSTFYALDDAPNSVTLQLNAILNNVTLFGQSRYTFWNQNVLFYSARTHTIQFLDNIWNFSSPQFYMSPNVFSSYDGNLVAPEFYYTLGPIFNVSFPFTVNFYLNSTVLNGDNTVFFNYTVVNSTGTFSGSYDEVQFNSTYGTSPGYSAPQANYLVTSTSLTPTNFIPYDAEIMLGGPGGGSTAMVYSINATMNLKYLASGNQYKNVPSAFNVGSETGETSTGIAETWTPNAVAHLSAGPSFVYGMWNVSQVNTFQKYTGTVNPPNSFMFVSNRSAFDPGNSSWSPLSQSGSYSFSLPSGMYSANILLSNHDPMSSPLSPGSPQMFNLPLNFSWGVYTPLYAFGNSQIPYISSYGEGTSYSPYVLFNNPSQTGFLNPLFSTFNDYIFPEFSGVLLHNTTSFVTIRNMPSFAVQYTTYTQLFDLGFFGITYTSNEIGYVLYQARNATIASNTISGWFSNTLTEFPVANVLLWDSQHNIIVSNYFDTMDSALMIFNSNDSQLSRNYVIANSFVQDQQLNKFNFPAISVSTTFGTSPVGPVAMTIYSSGNIITRNVVIVYNTAISPYYSIYTGNFAVYLNNWDGNFWWNYIPSGHIYNNYGQIFYGGDHNPAVIHGLTPGHLKRFVTNFMHR